MGPRDASPQGIPATDHRDGPLQAIFGVGSPGLVHGIGIGGICSTRGMREGTLQWTFVINPRFGVAAVDPRSPPSKCVPGVRDPGKSS